MLLKLFALPLVHPPNQSNIFDWTRHDFRPIQSLIEMAQRPARG